MAEKGFSWCESSDIVSMFPTFVWNIQLAAERAERVNSALREAIAELRRGEPALAAGRAWQSKQPLHERSAFEELGGYIGQAAQSVLSFQKVGYREMEITGSWANVNAPGAGHALHSHPNNFLSGVYYVHTPPGADTVYFHDPRIQTGILRPPVTELTAGNTDQVVLGVRPGTLLLFPAFVQHSVPPNRSAEERVSVSFNLMFSSFTAKLSKPLW